MKRRAVQPRRHVTAHENCEQDHMPAVIRVNVMPRRVDYHGHEVKRKEEGPS